MSGTDDASLRHSLQSLSSRNADSPLEAYLQAPPQAELERLLGFSLDPASYRHVVRQRAGQQANRPAAKQDMAKAVEDVVEADSLPLTEAAPEAVSALEAEAPPAGTLEMLAGIGQDGEPAPIEDVVPECSPVKPVIAPPLSPGSPEPCMIQFAQTVYRSPLSDSISVVSVVALQACEFLLCLVCLVLEHVPY